MTLVAVAQVVASSHSALAAGLVTSNNYQNVETVEVTARAIPTADEMGTNTRIIIEDIGFSGAVNLAQTLTQVPSVNLRTNSRGEVLASFRGSGERQLAVFWDGVPINVPWDNRFDLSLVPTLALQSISVHRGPASASFGANTAGGVVNITTKTLADSSFRFVAGTVGQIAADATASIDGGKVKTLLAGLHARADGQTAPSVEFSAENNGLITNTDYQRTSFLAKTVLQGNPFQLGFSVLYSSADFGIAPEQGARITPEDARYWRYPDSEHLLVSSSVAIPVSSSLVLDGRVWNQSFDQNIQSYTDISYREVEAFQQDENSSSGTKVQARYRSENQSATFSAVGQWANHQQLDQEVGLAAAEADRFTHFMGSIGFDYGWQFSSSNEVAVGVSYDVFDPGHTAGRESAGHFDGLNVSTELNLSLSDHWDLRFAAAKKVRLPTMRELFGGAIGRFVLNPDLAPETSWLFEAAAEISFPSGFIHVIPFWVETDDTLDQQRVEIAGETFSQRVNLSGSRTYGIESQAKFDVSERMQVSANATWSRTKLKPDLVANSAHRLYLSDRPNLLARVDARYQVGSETTFGLSVVHRGEAKSEDASGDFLDLSPATKIDLSLLHQFQLAPNGPLIELFALLNNLADVIVEPQLGLPEQGRVFTLGIKAVF